MTVDSFNNTSKGKNDPRALLFKCSFQAEHQEPSERGDSGAEQSDKEQMQLHICRSEFVSEYVMTLHYIELLALGKLYFRVVKGKERHTDWLYSHPIDLSYLLHALKANVKDF